MRLPRQRQTNKAVASGALPASPMVVVLHPIKPDGEQKTGIVECEREVGRRTARTARPSQISSTSSPRKGTQSLKSGGGEKDTADHDQDTRRGKQIEQEVGRETGGDHVSMLQEGAECTCASPELVGVSFAPTRPLKLAGRT